MKDFDEFNTWFAKELKEANISLNQPCVELLYKSFLCGLKPVKNPKIVVLAGGPGSGKTTFRKKHLKELNNYHIHDLDETLILLPGYQDQCKKEGSESAFKSWWPIAQRITNIMMIYATKNKLNIIYDRTCGTEASYLALKDAKKEGYDINLFAFYVEKEIALQRVIDRAKTEGRTVTPEIVCDYLQFFCTLWPYYLKMIDDVTLFENNGSDYKEIFVKHKRKSEVFSYADYKKFLSNALDTHTAQAKFPNISDISNEVLDDVRMQQYQTRKAELGLFYFSSKKIKLDLKLYKLSKNLQWINQAALWAEEKWGYIRGFPGISKREELVRELINEFYIITYGKSPIGMFALGYRDGDTNELKYVYVHETFRGLGIGNFIIEKAKQISREHGRKGIIFDTLNPNLNRFYEKLGAKAICDGELLGHPTTVFRM